MTDPGQMTEQSILEILDRAAADFSFPMLDNGYVYLAAARLSVHRSPADWALVFEIFGFSPRSGDPDVQVWSLGSRLDHHKSASDFVTEDAYRTFMDVHRHDATEFIYPLDDDWQDPEWRELVRPEAKVVLVRGEPFGIPGRATFPLHGIELAEPDRLMTYELCRYVAVLERERVLATPAERRTHLSADFDEVLVLDDWHHPNTVMGEVPSETAAFRSIARVLASGDASAYDPSEPGNSHWSNWPEGGTL